jgi:hypothetical protein
MFGIGREELCSYIFSAPSFLDSLMMNCSLALVLSLDISPVIKLR